MPLVFGTYAEANKESHELIKFCARTAAAHEHNARLSPEDLDSSRGSPFQLLLNQFRKAVGVLCIQNVVEEKLRQIMYIRPMKEGAKAGQIRATDETMREPDMAQVGIIIFGTMKLLMLSMRSAPSTMTTVVMTDLE